MPTIPLYAAGLRVEPPVCEPSATGHMPAATTTAEPTLDAPGVWSGCQGLTVAA